LHKHRPATDVRGVRLLYDNAPSHKEPIVHLKKQTVVEHPYPPYLPAIAICEFFLSHRLKKHLVWRKYQTQKISVRLFSSVWTVYFENIGKTHLKIGLRISHGGEYFEGLR
jgi:hypothetical protein